MTMGRQPVASSDRSVYVTGATGYIGGRLVLRLLEAGHSVRCLTRQRRKLESRSWYGDPRVEIVEGDAGDRAILRTSLRGCSAAYYLVHSMIVAGGEYADRDRVIAEVFGSAAAEAGVGRIIYLGGLGETGAGLSEHLESRRDVEHALASGGVPVTVFRAAMIIGSGSASFEILRYLVERLPAMVTPRWVTTEAQPISVYNVLHYLVRALEVPETTGRTLDIGGPEIMSYIEIMQIMAEARGLRRRLIVPIPVLSPKLSSLWLHIMTPISHRIARPLAEGLRNRVVCRDDEAVRLIPQPLFTVRESIEEALRQIAASRVETSWSDAGPMPGDPDWSGGTVFENRHTATLQASPAAVYRAVCRIGGGNGWYAADSLWRIRGFMDRLIGGPGLRRGRRDPENVRYGDALDFWRVTGIDPNRRLELRAEMKLPGEAILEFVIEPTEERPGWSRLVQTARFLPKGLGGLLYWYSVLPLHGIVFRGMLGGIRRAAEAEENQTRPAVPAAARSRKGF
ncbi:MAG: SDR family oxidoreductase [Candidatus Eisenbacteria bacterium]